MTTADAQKPSTPRLRPNSTGVRFLVVAACVVIVVAGLKAAAELLRPFVLALFLAIISLPLMRWLQRHRVPRSLAAVLTVVADIIVILLVMGVAGGSITALTQELPQYQAVVNGYLEGLDGWLASFGSWGAAEEVVSLRSLFDSGAVVDMVGSVLRSVADIATNALLVFLTMVFLLFEASGFGDKLRRAFGFGDQASGALYQALQRIQKYLVIKTGVSLVTGVLIATGLAILQVKFAILFGLLAFLLNYIPNLGSIIAAVPAVFLALVDQDPLTALLTGALFLVVNITIGNVVEPNLMGRRMGLSTLVVFLSLLFWGWVWGPVGMLLSVPLTMTAKILLENVEDFRWVAILMSKNPPPG